MKNTLKAIVLFTVIAAAAGAAAVAQTHDSMMGSHKASMTSQGMMSVEQMMSMCDQMMKDMRSDPVLMKHMNQMMQKHMMHGISKRGSIMGGGMMKSVHPSPSPHS